MNIKKVLALVLAAAAIVGLYALYQRRAEQREIAVFEESFAVYDEYMSAAKEYDLEKLSGLSYQLSETCKDETKRKDCEALMDNVSYFGQAISRENMRILSRDKKQIIIVGDYIESIEGEVASLTRPIVYFVRDNGNIKLLSFNPFQGVFFFRGDQATSTMTERLQKAVVDSDQDAVPDKTENCEDNESDTSCVKTDPLKKDSDKDGWWDSVEALFYRPEGASELSE